MSAWDPGSVESWARALGLVQVPLFGSGRHPPHHYVLLDGQRASFGLGLGAPHSQEPEDTASWAWSAHLNHFLEVDTNLGRLRIRRWDAPANTQQVRLPHNYPEAQSILDSLEHAQPPRHPDVVAYLLRAFDSLRTSVTNPVDAITLFNALLLGTERVRLGTISAEDFRSTESIADLFSLLEPESRSLVHPLEETPRDLALGFLPAVFLDSDPITGCSLEPELLLRHASSYLYQQAHLAIERDPQLSFPGLGLPRIVGDSAPRDVRFTPPSLARALVQQALDRVPNLAAKPRLHVLDPACGSGVFLQEIYRELKLRGYAGSVVLEGFDISPIATTITDFCLRWNVRPASSQVHVSIDARDALLQDWHTPDLVVMNPPFIYWRNLTSSQKEVVRSTLGSLVHKTPDMAMAFLWKAIQSIGSEGVVVAVLPSPLLESESGRRWRMAITEMAEIEVLGRFENSTYFTGAIVEPAFLVMTLKRKDQKQHGTQVVLARQGFENAALRSLRRDPEGAEHHGEWDTFRVPSKLVVREDWVPRWRSQYIVLERLAKTHMTRVKDLFHVRQGARPGMRKAFILSSGELSDLPESEHKYFRPIADNMTIHNGKLHPEHFIFFPYSSAGLLLETEETLQEQVPMYYSRFLDKHRIQLANRSRAKEDQWWVLTHERKWQRTKTKKLVSTYFGDRGSFAYDETGDFVVVQGWAWLWRVSDTKESKGVGRLPWAYLAVLNSSVFEDLLEIYCPKVVGGQFNLSSKFVSEVFLPDLGDDTRVRPSLLRDLGDLGREVEEGGLEERRKEIDELVRILYGMPDPEEG